MSKVKTSEESMSERERMIKTFDSLGKESSDEHSTRARVFIISNFPYKIALCLKV